MLLPLYYDIFIGVILIFTSCILFVSRKVVKVPQEIVFIVVIVTILLLGLAPAIGEVGNDREGYAMMLSNLSLYLQYGFRDSGFITYLKICKAITNNPIGMFLISASLYVSCYQYFTYKCAPQRNFYILLACFASLGFANYHYNILREGLAIAIVLIAISKNQKLYISAICFILAITVHISVILLIVCYLATIRVKSTKLLYICWFLILFNLLIGTFNSFDQWMSYVNMVDNEERLSSYLMNQDSEYKVGLRLDFIAYSFIPIIAGYVYIYRNDFQDAFYHHIYNTYILCNACWLIVSRIPFNDRFAYLSWFLMPIILIYPLVSSNQKIQNRKLYLIMSLFLISGINFSLKYFL